MIRERLLKGGAIVFLGKLFSAFSLLVVNALLARLLQPEEYGAYFLTLSLVTTAAMFGQLGLNRAVVKFVAEALAKGKPGQAKWVIHKVLIICLCCALAVGLSIYAGLGNWLAESVFHSKPMAQVVWLISVWVVIFSMQGLFGEIFRGLHKITFATLFSGLCTGVFSAVAFTLLWLLNSEASFEEVIIISMLSGLASLILANIFLHGDIGQHTSASNIDVAQVLKLAMPMFITGFSLFGVREMHMWVLGVFQPDSDVALYGACTRLMTLLTMPLLIVNAVLPATIVELNTQGKTKKLQEVLRNSATLATAPAVLGFIVVLLFGTEILELVFGSYYQQASHLLLLLAGIAVINVLVGSPGMLLMMTGHEKQVMWSALLAGLGGVFASVIMTNIYGLIGVGIGLGVGIVSHNIYIWYYARRKLSINTHGGWLQLLNMLRWAMQYLQHNNTK